MNRQLRQTPIGNGHVRAAAAPAVVTVALGVAVISLLFAVVKAVLLNPLPYPQPDRLAFIASVAGNASPRTSTPDFDDWQRASRSFTAMASSPAHASLYCRAAATRRSTCPVPLYPSRSSTCSGSVPAVGRGSLPEEHRGRRNARQRGIPSDGLWQRASGGDPGIVGRRIDAPRVSSTVVAVTSGGIAYPICSDVWVSSAAPCPKQYATEPRRTT